MALNLYRRHYRKPGKCLGGHPPDSRSYEPEELRRKRKKCLCPIYADGTLGGSFKRRNTDKLTWDEARAAAARWEGLGYWGQPTPPPPQHESVLMEFNPSAETVTLRRAISAFLREHAESSAPNTLKKYTLIMKKLMTYAESQGYVLIEQLRPIDVREFRHSWNVSPLTASKNMGVVKAFFEFALSNEWVDRNPARLVKPPRSRSENGARHSQRLPFSDDELERMFQACRSRYAKDARWRYSWTGQDLEDFISVSVYTGLRISDVCTFHIDRLLPSGECHVRTAKNGRRVFTWLPPWLQSRVRTRAEQHGPLIFGTHTTDDTNVVTDVWRRKLKRLWALCGPWKEKPTPHRFRHTFARILLERSNVTVRDVAELLGDTEDVVRRHYAAWVPERQERLTTVLREAFSDKPKPKVIAIR